MARFKAPIKSYLDAETFLGNRPERTVAHNTRVIRHGPNTIAVRYHWTAVVTFHRDGRITLDTGGWQTPTTRDRFRACGIPVSMTDGIVDVSHHGRGYVYQDGMILHPNGTATGCPDVEPREARRRRRNLLRRDRSVPRWENRQGGVVPCGVPVPGNAHF